MRDFSNRPGGFYTCGGEHYTSVCLQRRNIQNDRNQHHIHAAVDNCQADYQATPIQLSGKNFGCSISILIDTGATDSFVDPNVVSKLSVRPSYMENSWKVQYGNRVERKVEQFLFCSELKLPSLGTQVNLYVEPLGSYDVILGINWLTEHKALVDCEKKIV